MLYYSDKTRTFYKTAEECEEAEQKLLVEQKRKEEEALQKSNARKDAAKKVEEAYEKVVAAQKEYKEVLSEFCKEHGSFHMTLDKNGILDWMDTFWGNWF